MQAVLKQPQTETRSQTSGRVFAQIEKCLRQGCVIRIEHASTLAPRFSPWQTWGEPACYNGDSQQIFAQIAACQTAYGDHHIRLSIEDYSCHSRFSFVVHQPLAAAA